jgi:hypothetical protein
MRTSPVARMRMPELTLPSTVTEPSKSTFPVEMSTAGRTTTGSTETPAGPTIGRPEIAAHNRSASVGSSCAPFMTGENGVFLPGLAFNSRPLTS